MSGPNSNWGLMAPRLSDRSRKFGSGAGRAVSTPFSWFMGGAKRHRGLKLSSDECNQEDEKRCAVAGVRIKLNL